MLWHFSQSKNIRNSARMWASSRLGSAAGTRSKNDAFAPFLMRAVPICGVWALDRTGHTRFATRNLRLIMASRVGSYSMTFVTNLRGRREDGPTTYCSCPYSFRRRKDAC